MTVVDDLRVARAHVERGWTQGQLGDFRGNVCAMGAVALASGMTIGSHSSEVSEWQRHLAQYEELKKHLPEKFIDVAEFNDDPNTTQQDVLDLFEKAIADLGGMAAA